MYSNDSIVNQVAYQDRRLQNFAAETEPNTSSAKNLAHRFTEFNLKHAGRENKFFKKQFGDDYDSLSLAKNLNAKLEENMTSSIDDIKQDSMPGNIEKFQVGGEDPFYFKVLKNITERFASLATSLKFDTDKVFSTDKSKRYRPSVKNFDFARRNLAKLYSFLRHSFDSSKSLLARENIVTAMDKAFKSAAELSDSPHSPFSFLPSENPVKHEAHLASFMDNRLAEKPADLLLFTLFPRQQDFDQNAANELLDIVSEISKGNEDDLRQEWRELKTKMAKYPRNKGTIANQIVRRRLSSVAGLDTGQLKTLELRYLVLEAKFNPTKEFNMDHILAKTELAEDDAQRMMKVILARMKIALK